MKRPVRIVIELVGPPVVAGLLLSLEALFSTPTVWPRVALVVVLGAYVYGALPTVLYVIIMESFFACGVRSGSIMALILSSSLGALAAFGSVVISVEGRIGMLDSWSFTIAPILGFVVGFAIWCLVRWASDMRFLNRAKVDVKQAT